MKIAIDTSPLQSGHKVRGVGFYLHHLRDALEQYFPQNSYTFFTDASRIPALIDIIHYPYFEPFQLARPLFKKKPTVVTIHDLTPIKFPQHFPVGKRGALMWRLNKMLLKSVDAIITDSEASKHDIISLAGVPGEKISVVYLAAASQFKQRDLPQSKIQDLRSKYNLPEKFVLYVGDVTWNKNLPRLVRAVQKEDIHLVLAGKALAQQDFDRSNPWTNDLQEVQQLASNDERIHILGFVPDEDLVTLYNAATVFVMPSLYEGFGLPVIEAMQSGCPVITTGEGSLPEVGGEAVYYTDAQDTEAMAETIVKVLHDSRLRNRLREKGLERAKQFSWRLTAEKTIAVYERVLAKA
jgi:glycosyltransferase involved in cell wall biosynthesis